MVYLGDQLGLYKTMAAAGPVTPGALAAKTATDERYVREWLANQAASGYVEYDSATSKYHLPPEHAMLLAREDSPLNMHGLFELIETVMHDEPRLSECLRTGKGFGWHEHDPQLFPATDRFFRPGYAVNLVQSWIPALEGVETKLKRGARVADVGCGLGSSTVLLAKAFPESQVTGFDYHPSSIEQARKKASAAGLGDKVRFEVAGAQDFPGQDYDFIACFDCIHDMGDPVGALARVRNALKPDGTLMIVEPFAEDTLEKNLNAVGRIYYGFSTTLCTPSAKSQPGGYSLGAQAGEPRMHDVATKAGFTRFRRATQTPFNIVYEARR
jgi:ubiquinone/menaquinone biosynthesis C-methylase UbiE